MTFDNEDGNATVLSTMSTDEISPVKLKSHRTRRLSKEEYRRSLPSHPERNRQYSESYINGGDKKEESFEETMRLNLPFHAQNKSPKTRHKNHRSKQSMSPYKAFPQFDVEDFTRSYSDSAILINHDNRAMKTVRSNDISNWSYVNTEEFKKPLRIQHKHGETACHMISNGFGPDKNIALTQSSSVKKGITRACAKDVPTESGECDQGKVSAQTRERLAYKNFQNADESIPKTESIIPKIRDFENMCHQNYEQVQSDIHDEFLALTKLIEKRKKALLEEAKNIYDRKLNSLDDVKVKYRENIETHFIDAAECNHSSSISSEPLGTDDMKTMEKNGIVEPWGREEDLNDKSASDSYKSTEARLCAADEVLSSFLEEGNVSCTFSNDFDKFIDSFGKIEENLSSAQYSFVTGTPEGNIVTGDIVNVQVHTRNIYNEETNNNPKDKIELTIYDNDKQKVNLAAVPVVAAKLEHILHFIDGQNEASVEEKDHSYTFKAIKPGRYEIHVNVNGVNMSRGPYSCIVYPKQSLTFENHIAEKRTHRSLSEPEESSNSHEWVVKKGGKASLLRYLGEKPCCIYANQVVTDTSAWKVKLTSACSDIVISIGVGTKTNIPQIDEQFTCKFLMKDFQKQINRDRNVKRRESQFTRPPITFSVLLKDGFVRVTCHELKQDKYVEVKLSIDKSLSLYPFCTMVHCHDEYFSQVCPSPQITLL